jgi:hypothetical protein
MSSRRRFWTRQILVTGLACAATAILTFAATNTPTPVPSVPAFFLRKTMPIEVDIQCNGAAKPLENMSPPIWKFEGTAHFKFTNTSDKVVRLAFPPLREFEFSDTQLGEVRESRFAADQQILVLAPGESKTFTEPLINYVMTRQPLNEFWKGGPGIRGFIFGPPAGEDPGDYCVGTIFPIYRLNLTSN